MNNNKQSVVIFRRYKTMVIVFILFFLFKDFGLPLIRFAILTILILCAYLLLINLKERTSVIKGKLKRVNHLRNRHGSCLLHEHIGFECIFASQESFLA